MAEGTSVAALIAGAGLPEDADVATLPGLTWHVSRPLKQAGIATVGDLATRTDEQLQAVPNFGGRRLQLLKAAIATVRS